MFVFANVLSGRAGGFTLPAILITSGYASVLTTMSGPTLRLRATTSVALRRFSKGYGGSLNVDERVSKLFLRVCAGVHTTEDKLVELTPCKLSDVCLRAMSLAAAKVRAESSPTCSFLIKDSNLFSKTANFRRFQANLSGNFVDGAVSVDSAYSRVKRLLIQRAY